MRREMTLLRIELEQLRAKEDEARKTKEFLFAYIDRVVASRDRWRREAERLRVLTTDAPCAAHARTREKPHWSLFWWRNTK
jgi:hypothetical protein